MSRRSVTLDQIKAQQRYALVGGPFGSNLVTRDYRDDGVPVIRGNNLSEDKTFSFDDLAFVSEEKADELLPNNAYPGDLVFTQRGTLGQVGLIPVDAPYPRFVISQSQMKLTVDPAAASARFLYYYFRLPETVQRIKNQAITSGVPHINLEILKRFEVCLPSLAEQERIAAILRAYDDLIENNRRRIQLLEQAARLIWEEWFVRLRFPGYEQVRIVDGLPEGWERKTAYDAMDILSGGTPKTDVAEYWDGDVPFYTSKDAVQVPYVLKTEKTITERGLATCNSRLYPRNTVFISARGTVGKINLTQRPMAMSQSCYALVGRLPISQLYLYCAMKAAVGHFKQHAVGAIFDAIVVNTFKQIPFTVPSESLVETFTCLVQPMFGAVENLLAQNAALREARDLLLPGLMSGEIEA